MKIKEVTNWIEGKECTAVSGKWFNKLDPANGKELFKVARSSKQDVEKAVASAKAAQYKWAETPAVQRGMILHRIVNGMQEHQKEIAEIVAAETGKSMKDALGETNGAIQLGIFFASEGQRLYGRTTTSGVPNKYAMTVRQPIGVAGLIIAANTPIANVAWKIFPALVCGNSAVLKAAEDTPATAWIVGKIAHEAGLPPGVLNIVQGYGEEAGAPLVEHPDVGLISFTGSTAVGHRILKTTSERMARVSLELGGKNPLVVCDDADLENACKWVLLSAFSNAGQRCASTSRVIIFDSIYNEFRDMLIENTRKLKIGTSDDDDLGPVINETQMKNILSMIDQSANEGAKILIGGKRLQGNASRNGYFIAPTLIENVQPEADISCKELFGPVAILYRVKDFDEALSLANESTYGLTASIHTRSIHRSVRFCEKIQSGVVVVNAGTHGSEPHMPFGGIKNSGNGTREPGTEALDVYTELKDVYINIDPTQI